MQPVVHLAVGYLCYAGYARWRGDGAPAEAPAFAAIVGAALPDLLDKPIWLGVAFAVGALSHVATDIPWHVIAGDYDELGFLLWPLTPMPEYSGTKPLGTVPGLGLEATTLWLEAVILVAGVALWWYDGRPGTGTVRRLFGGKSS